MLKFLIYLLPFAVVFDIHQFIKPVLGCAPTSLSADEAITNETLAAIVYAPSTMSQFLNVSTGGCAMTFSLLHSSIMAALGMTSSPPTIADIGPGCPSDSCMNTSSISCAVSVSVTTTSCKDALVRLLGVDGTVKPIVPCI